MKMIIVYVLPNLHLPPHPSNIYEDRVIIIIIIFRHGHHQEEHWHVLSGIAHATENPLHGHVAMKKTESCYL